MILLCKMVKSLHITTICFQLFWPSNCTTVKCNNLKEVWTSPCSPISCDLVVVVIVAALPINNTDKCLISCFHILLARPICPSRCGSSIVVLFDTYYIQLKYTELEHVTDDFFLYSFLCLAVGPWEVSELAKHILFLRKKIDMTFCSLKG